MDDLVEEMLSQAPMLITNAELIDYKRRAQIELHKAREDELNQIPHKLLHIPEVYAYKKQCRKTAEEVSNNEHTE
jgi:hypothetical protein